MERRVILLLLLVVAGLVFGAEYFDLPWMAAVVLVGVGLLACVGGVRLLARGGPYEARGRASDPRYYRRYTGLSTRLIGVFLVLGGLVFVVLGALDAINPGGASAFLVWLSDSRYGWAPILGVAGLLVTAMGIVRLFSGSGLAPGVYDRHVEWSIRFGGAVSALTGLTMLALALGLVFIPGLPQMLIDLLAVLFEQAAGIIERLG